MNTSFRLAAVVLAAGLSSRMQGEHKLFRAWKGKPLLRHCIDTLKTLPLEQKIIVISQKNEAVQSSVPLHDFLIIPNPAPEKGMSSSLKLGISALADKVDGVFICLGDMPLVPSSVFGALAEAFRSSESDDICVPVCEGKQGNPVLWGSRWFPDILSLEGDVGAKSLIRKNPSHVKPVPVEDRAVLIDFDLPRDFEDH